MKQHLSIVKNYCASFKINSRMRLATWIKLIVIISFVIYFISSFPYLTNYIGIITGYINCHEYDTSLSKNKSKATINITVEFSVHTAFPKNKQHLYDKIFR